MSRSWLDERKTDRSYKVKSWKYESVRVRNEYQQLNCLHCGKAYYSRLTHLFLYEPDKIEKFSNVEYHINYKTSLEEFYDLRISGNNNFSLYEKLIDDKWYIVDSENRVIGEQII